MKVTRSILFSACMGAATLALTSPWALAQPPGGTPPAGAAPGAAPGGAGRGAMRGSAAPLDYNDNTGWESLFDGKTLKGWEGAPGMWNIDDGAIHIDTACEHPTGTTYIYYTGGEFGDFMLKYDMKGTQRVNGGMQFRSFLTEDPNAAKYPPRQGGGGGGGRRAGAGADAAGAGGAGRGPGGAGAPAGANGAGAAAAAGGPGRAGAPGGPGGGGGGGRAGQPPITCAVPPPPQPDRASLVKWNMNGYQVDFDANNQWPGNIYEQGARGVMTTPGHAILAEPGQPVKITATLADKATLDSWFNKDDYNHFLLIAKGNTIQTYMNGHLVFVMVDDDPTYFRASGKIGPEVESQGGYWVKNIFLKKL